MVSRMQFKLKRACICATARQVAILLGWPLMETAHFGQAHLEAADILTRYVSATWLRGSDLSGRGAKWERGEVGRG